MVFSSLESKSADGSKQTECNSGDRSIIKISMIDLIQSTILSSSSEEEVTLRLLISNQKDQTDSVASHTQKGVDFLERIGSFAKERALIEEEYAAKLRTLAKKSLGKKKEDEEAIKSFTCVRSFANLLREMESLAAQHEVIGERIRKDVLPFVTSRANLHRSQRKQCLADLQTIHANLNGAIEHMLKSQKHYGKTFKDAEAAYLKYSKAEKNMEISRLDLEKAKNNAQMRSQISEEAKHAYAHALQGANDAQNTHYGQNLPDALERMRNIDQERIKDTRTAMEMCILAESDVRPIVARCHEDMRKAVDQIDTEKDTAMVVEQFKTGYMRPPPFQFEDLGRPDGLINGNGDGLQVDSTLKRGMLSGGRRDAKGGVSRKQSMHQKFFGGGDKHKVEANGDYGQLPPQQRIRRLQAKINELEKEREKSLQSKDGLAKMQQVYKENPKLGNAADCESQLAQYTKEIDQINQQIVKFRTLLDDANAQNNLPLGGSDTPPSARSASSASSAPPRPPQPQDQRTSYSEEESITSSDGGRNGNERRDEVYEECTMPALGTAVVQFSFEGGTEGTIRIQEGDELLLIEKDEGDGWTRVRR
uniref:SH3 domain-containing protein n=1 Tax=Heterorhabditis bacteriophora TaxID=37862 RepID=A0A1I7XGD1_HETBA